MLAWRATSAASPHSASRTAAGIHHRIGDAAHQILAEAYLRIHDARGSDDLAAAQIAQVRSDRGRTHVDRQPVRELVQAGPDGDDLLGGVHRDGNLPRSRAQRRLQRLQHRQITSEILEAPFGFQRLEQPAQIAGRIVHVRLLHLNVVQAYDRIELDHVRVGVLAHHLAVDLTARGHVDDHVALDARRARQAPAFGHGHAPRVALFRLAERRQAGAGRGDAVLGELALRDQYLAAPAKTAAAADRVDIHAETARSLQQRRPYREIAALAGRREYDEWISSRHANRLTLSRAPAMAAFTAAARRFTGGARGARGGRSRVAKAANPTGAIGIMPQHDVRAHDGLDDFHMHRIGNGRGHPGSHGHRQKRAVDAVAVRQPEADVRGTAGGIDLEFRAQFVHQAHDLHARLIDRADGHDQRIDDDVARRDAMVHRPLDDFLRHREAHVRIFGYPGLVVRYRDYRGAVLLDERQHGFQTLILAGHRIDQRLALVDGKPGLERGDDG